MCGIVGILGSHEVAPIILDALKRLEYRGYDSAGIATINDGALDRRRAVGKLVELSDLLVHDPLPGKSGIGHTRWATHGAANVQNAHPHRAGPVAVVHNGIIENFRDLREELERKGYAFETDTDTETVVALTAKNLESGMSPKDAAFATIDRLDGAFALAFLFEGEADLMIAARKGSPLAIGHGNGEMYVGSDALSLAPMTNQVTYLAEGDRAVLTRDGATIWDEAGNRANRPVQTISFEVTSAEKGAFSHFMAKEIAEQPTVLGNAIRHFLDETGRRIAIPEGEPDFTRADRLVMVACGTAYLACSVAKYWFEKLARLPVEIDIASEFRYREPPVTKDTVSLFVSQSGETADTLAALRYCVERTDQTIGVVNVAESTISRECGLSLPIMAGIEIGVASTKAFTCQLVTLAALAITAARQRGRIDKIEEERLVDELKGLPALINTALAGEDKITAAARKIAKAEDVLFLGRGQMYPLALEGALKLKEISYIHAEGYAAGELKHGPIALVDKKVPIVVIAPSDPLFDKTASNMQEVMAREGRVLLITDAKGAKLAGKDAWRTLVMPDAPLMFAPILYAVPVQLLAYHAALFKGTDVDQPRNLAKSVTVE